MTRSLLDLWLWPTVKTNPHHCPAQHHTLFGAITASSASSAAFCCSSTTAAVTSPVSSTSFCAAHRRCASNSSHVIRSSLFVSPCSSTQKSLLNPASSTNLPTLASWFRAEASSVLLTALSPLASIISPC